MRPTHRQDTAKAPTQRTRNQSSCHSPLASATDAKRAIPGMGAFQNQNMRNGNSGTVRRVGKRPDNRAVGLGHAELEGLADAPPRHSLHVLLLHLDLAVAPLEAHARAGQGQVAFRRLPRVTPELHLECHHPAPQPSAHISAHHYSPAPLVWPNRVPLVRSSFAI